jgi:hypothetical protein
MIDNRVSSPDGPVCEGPASRRRRFGGPMTFRLSHKLNSRIKAGNLPTLALDVNPFADWTAHLFVADRTQYILLSNTKSLYSTVLYGKGITDDSHFIKRALGSLREYMQDDGLVLQQQQFRGVPGSIDG